MAKHLPWIIFAVVLLVPNAKLYGQSATQTATQQPSESADKNPFVRLLNNGAWWNTLSEDAKSDFVDGYVTAMAKANRMLIGFVKQNSKELQPEPGPKFDAQVSAILQLSVIAEHFEYEEVGRVKLLAGVDAFYKEALNKLIPIEYALAFERDTINGKVAPRELQKQLDELRASINK